MDFFQAQWFLSNPGSGDPSFFAELPHRDRGLCVSGVTTDSFLHGHTAWCGLSTWQPDVNAQDVLGIRKIRGWRVFSFPEDFLALVHWTAFLSIGMTILYDYSYFFPIPGGGLGIDLLPHWILVLWGGIHYCRHKENLRVRWGSSPATFLTHFL